MSISVLVAGGAGFIGSHLVDRLLRRSDVERIEIVDNLWTGRRENLSHIDDPRVSLTIQDIERADLGRYDEIYHLASPATPLSYMAEPVRTISANVCGAIHMLRALKPGGLICYTSTSEVYGDAEVSPQPESYRGSVDCTGPRASYDESKRCTEALLLEASRVHGVRVKIARVFNTFGPRTRPDDGRAVSNFIAQALRGEPLTVYGDGQQTRCWGYVDDIVDALERFFWRDGVEFPGPLNIGNDRQISVADVARYIAANYGGQAGVNFLPPVPQDPDNRLPDLALARAHLAGWRCQVSYEEGIDRTVEWFRRELAATCDPRSGLHRVGGIV
ncbi:NAD-dependent epimerase/dehydratase family protein [Caulobacter sp. BP25]|uniref:NAD-dependent epimerase/dehydratase family protein n=1 Tax=Caulobacter sp. BP25 TaxID=2048900 RepID=UPI000C12C9D3|nr:NAD-dependent epimerase/dehydratase family protein [Caulobacter sp. BP25]PHY22907.1 UDP-glucose 4-epimerase [Caulobacter sp. BP25]